MPVMQDNVLSWGSDLEQATIDQAKLSAKMPFVEGHVALMPDAHIGRGATIGSVIPTRGAIIPSAVGVDIGCGMIAARLPFHADLLPDDLDRLLGWIGMVVPAGVGKGREKRGTWNPPVALPHYSIGAGGLTPKELTTAQNQMGSLGSGNHFVEVCVDETDRVWIVLHSGSRGVGNQVATRHIEKAKKLMKRYFIELPDPDLAYVVEGTSEFNDYISDMLWAQDYALMNRQTMMDAVLSQMQGFVGFEFDPVETINCHHNFAQREHHNGHDVWITRKGAIKAYIGDRGVIPGSMGTKSYIVTGLGNPSSYGSSSHGAGRRMSRSAARKTLDLEGFKASMGDRAWLKDQAGKLLDEDPRSYKDIDVVMSDQADLVQIDHTLTQILNFKGL